jgi:hypothetical protein
VVWQERLAALLEERKRLVAGSEEGSGAKVHKKPSGQPDVDSVAMVEREARRLEVLKRRQEREMNQLIQFELLRNAMQACTGCPAQAWTA